MKTYPRILEQVNSLLDAKGGNKAALMRLAEVDEGGKSKFYKFLSGDSVPSGDALLDWLEKLGFIITPPDKKLAEYEMIPKVAAQAGAGSSLVTSDKIIEHCAFKRGFLQAAHICIKKAVLMDVLGKSMEPTIFHNDTILVDESARDLKDGEIFLVGFGDDLLIKRVQRSPKGWILKSDNRDFSDIEIAGECFEHFRVFGKVKWFGRLL